MNKRELTEAFAKEIGLTLRDAESALIPSLTASLIPYPKVDGLRSVALAALK